MLEENRIHLGDCLDLMRLLPDKSIDLVLTDPPYGINAAGQSLGLRKEHAHCRTWEKKNWDTSAPSKEYFDEIFRVSKNQIIWGGNYFGLPPFEFYVLWDKQITGDVPFSDCELAWTSLKGAPKIARIRVQSINENRTHPTQKPIKLFQWCLERYSQPSDLILDPFSGSGTTAIAAHNLGRRFICIEKDEDYHAASVQRLKDTQAQLRLF